MSFSSDVRNAFVQRRKPAGELIPRPLYGDLYLMGLSCGHTIFCSGHTNWITCTVCGYPDVVMVSVKVRHG